MGNHATTLSEEILKVMEDKSGGGRDKIEEEDVFYDTINEDDSEKVTVGQRIQDNSKDTAHHVTSSHCSGNAIIRQTPLDHHKTHHPTEGDENVASSESEKSTSSKYYSEERITPSHDNPPETHVRDSDEDIALYKTEKSPSSKYYRVRNPHTEPKEERTSPNQNFPQETRFHDGDQSCIALSKNEESPSSKYYRMRTPHGEAREERIPPTQDNPPKTYACDADECIASYKTEKSPKSKYYHATTPHGERTAERTSVCQDNPLETLTRDTDEDIASSKCEEMPSSKYYPVKTPHHSEAREEITSPNQDNPPKTNTRDEEMASSNKVHSMKPWPSDKDKKMASSYKAKDQSMKVWSRDSYEEMASLYKAKDQSMKAWLRDADEEMVSSNKAKDQSMKAWPTDKDEEMASPYKAHHGYYMKARTREDDEVKDPIREGDDVDDQPFTSRSHVLSSHLGNTYTMTDWDEDVNDPFEKILARRDVQQTHMKTEEKTVKQEPHPVMQSTKKLQADTNQQATELQEQQQQEEEEEDEENGTSKSENLIQLFMKIRQQQQQDGNTKSENITQLLMKIRQQQKQQQQQQQQHREEEDITTKPEDDTAWNLMKIRQQEQDEDASNTKEYYGNRKLDQNNQRNHEDMTEHEPQYLQHKWSDQRDPNAEEDDTQHETSSENGLCSTEEHDDKTKEEHSEPNYPKQWHLYHQDRTARLGDSDDGDNDTPPPSSSDSEDQDWRAGSSYKEEDDSGSQYHDTNEDPNPSRRVSSVQQYDGEEDQHNATYNHCPVVDENLDTSTPFHHCKNQHPESKNHLAVQHQDLRIQHHYNQNTTSNVGSGNENEDTTPSRHYKNQHQESRNDLTTDNQDLQIHQHHYHQSTTCNDESGYDYENTTKPSHQYGSQHQEREKRHLYNITEEDTTIDQPSILLNDQAIEEKKNISRSEHNGDNSEDDNANITHNDNPETEASKTLVEEIKERRGSGTRKDGECVDDKEQQLPRSHHPASLMNRKSDVHDEEKQQQRTFNEQFKSQHTPSVMNIEANVKDEESNEEKQKQQTKPSDGQISSSYRPSWKNRKADVQVMENDGKPQQQQQNTRSCYSQLSKDTISWRNKKTDVQNKKFLSWRDNGRSACNKNQHYSANQPQQEQYERYFTHSYSNHRDNNNDTSTSNTSNSSHSHGEGGILKPDQLAKSLVERPKFYSTLMNLQFYKSFDPESVQKVATAYPHIFHMRKDEVELQPQIKLCQAHVSSQGCINGVTCQYLHICKTYITGWCSESYCKYGHSFFTQHNKPILKMFCLEGMQSSHLKKLFGHLMGSVASTPDRLDVCEDYNNSRCNKTDCQALHICLRFLITRGKCERPQCDLNHNPLNQTCCLILRAHGISTNETIMDIIMEILNANPSLIPVSAPKSDTKNTTENLRPTKQNSFFDKVKQTFKNSSVKKEESPDSYSPENRESPHQGSLHKNSSGKKSERDRNSSDTDSDKRSGRDKDSKASQRTEKKHGSDKFNSGGARGESQSTWSYHPKGNVETAEICRFSVESICLKEDQGCKRLHSSQPFHWQVCEGRNNTWFNLPGKLVSTIEFAYCDPAKHGVLLPPLEPAHLRRLKDVLNQNTTWYANFEAMVVTNAAHSQVLPLRRLSIQTGASLQNAKSSTFNWYFCDINRRWVKYGQTDSTGKARQKSSITSADIETHFLARPNVPLVFKVSQFTYDINFSGMTQTNLSTKVKRAVRRRPELHPTLHSANTENQ